MRTKMEMEVEMARGIAVSAQGALESLKGYWAPSKRGSNCQRQLDSLEAKLVAIVQCLDDATKETT